MTKLYDITHSYSCVEHNYYDDDCTIEYDSWSEFYAENKDLDVDMNLVFRWGWKHEEQRRHLLQLSIMQQGRGVFAVWLVRVKKSDEAKVKKFLEPHAQYMRELWHGV